MSAIEATKPDELTVIVNTREKKVTTTELSFDQVVKLAFDNPPSGANVVITITYRNAADHKSGSLTAGQSVAIRNGTIFNVTATDKS